MAVPCIGGCVCVHVARFDVRARAHAGNTNVHSCHCSGDSCHCTRLHCIQSCTPSRAPWCTLCTETNSSPGWTSCKWRAVCAGMTHACTAHRSGTWLYLCTLDNSRSFLSPPNHLHHQTHCCSCIGYWSGLVLQCSHCCTKQLANRCEEAKPRGRR